jgi:hypothetical protein
VRRPAPFTPRTSDLARHIFAKRPRCRACNSVALRSTRTIGRDGDTVMRYVRCRQCGGNFILVLE